MNVYLTRVLFPSIVEFGTREEALRAITELNEQVLMGRPVYLREVSNERDCRPVACHQC